MKRTPQPTDIGSIIFGLSTTALQSSLRFISLLLLLVVLSPDVRGQPVVNGGFETGELAPWFQARVIPINQGGENWHVTTSDARSGAYSATLTGNKELRQNFAPVPSANIFQISFWAKHPDITVNQIAFSFFYSDGFTSEAYVYTTTMNFEYFDLTSSLSVGRNLSGISVWGNTFGRTYLDDVTVAVIPEPSSQSFLFVGLVVAIGRSLTRLGHLRRHVRI